MWKLRKNGGKEKENIHTFPNYNEILNIDLEELGFGYRSDYIKETCKEIPNFKEPEVLMDMSYKEAHEELKNLKGVGDKVADCVLLYSLDFNQAVPIDSWIRGLIEKEYPSLYSDDYMEMQMNIQDYFGENAGYAQLYLFHYFRSNT
jgi:N-glycosylase/DNA lyase